VLCCGVRRAVYRLSNLSSSKVVLIPEFEGVELGVLHLEFEAYDCPFQGTEVGLSLPRNHMADGVGFNRVAVGLSKTRNRIYFFIQD